MVEHIGQPGSVVRDFKIHGEGYEWEPEPDVQYDIVGPGGTARAQRFRSGKTYDYVVTNARRPMVRRVRNYGAVPLIAAVGLAFLYSYMSLVAGGLVIATYVAAHGGSLVVMLTAITLGFVTFMGLLLIGAIVLIALLCITSWHLDRRSA